LAIPPLIDQFHAPKNFPASSRFLFLRPAFLFLCKKYHKAIYFPIIKNQNYVSYILIRYNHITFIEKEKNSENVDYFLTFL